MHKVNWPAVLDQHQRSGLSQKRFCEQQGIAYSTFTHWKKKVGSVQDSIDLVPQFIELRPAPSVAPSIVIELPYGVVMRFTGVGP